MKGIDKVMSWLRSGATPEFEDALVRSWSAAGVKLEIRGEILWLMPGGKLFLEDNNTIELSSISTGMNPAGALLFYSPSLRIHMPGSDKVRAREREEASAVKKEEFFEWAGLDSDKLCEGCADAVFNAISQRREDDALDAMVAQERYD